MNTTPRRRSPRKAKPVLVGKRGAPLLDNPCIHRTTTVNDICLQCGKHVPDEAPAPPEPPAPRGPVVIPPRGPVLIPPRAPVLIPLSPIDRKVARFIASRMRPLTEANIAAHLGLDTSLIAASLQALKRRELVVQPRGEYTHGWVATEMLRNRGVVA